MNDDRIKSDDAEKKLPKPEIYIIRNGDAVFKPGMKTWFVETREEKVTESGGAVKGSTGNTVTSTVCICNKVAVPTAKPCSCNKVSGGSYCSCNKVCTCKPVH